MKAETKDFRHNYSEWGKLVFIEGNHDVPFDLKRVYYICDVPTGVRRGFHAHKQLEQYLICVHGECKVMLDDGTNKEVVLLDDPKKGLHIKPGMWREMYDFSEGAVLLVIASTYYDESDYIRDYNDFLKFKAGREE